MSSDGEKVAINETIHYRFWIGLEHIVYLWIIGFNILIVSNI